MTFPRSDGATRSSTTVAPSCSTTSTRTADGSSTSAFAMSSTRSFIAVHPGRMCRRGAGPRGVEASDAGAGALRLLSLDQEAPHRLRRVRPLLDPCLRLVDVELDRLGMRPGIVGPQT